MTKHEETEAELAAPALGKALPISIIAITALASTSWVAYLAHKAATDGTVKQAEKLKKKAERKKR